MCGIGGCVLRAGQEPCRERLTAMRDALGHRGPDGSGVEIFDNVGLVHTRLAIVDVTERAHQPMRHPGGDWWLTYNGEIFNHQTLRAELDQEVFSSGGDTETLLHAIARWGPAVLPRLNGQFAFAALDLKGRKLLLARDRFGIKPLYIADCDDGTWFASEPQALFAAGVKASARQQSWPSIFDWSCYRQEKTLFRDIRRVLPGTWVEIDIGTSVPRSHRWEPAAHHAEPERQRQLAFHRRPSLAAQLETTLRSAVHDALLSDVPVGTFCSGGVDSSLVTALAAEVKPDLVAFGARYRGDPTVDEGPAVLRVADALGVECDLLEVTKQGWRSDFVEATLHFGAPLATASSVTISQMAKRARHRGIKVVLTGEGADELFAGYGHPRRSPMGQFLSRNQRAMRNLEQLVSEPPAYTARAVLSRARGVAGVRLEDPPILPPETGGANNEPTGRDSATDASVGSEIEMAYRNHFGPRRVYETILLRDLDFTLSHLLNRMDKNVMQASVEARVPFLDPRVVEFALNLPLEARVTPWSKGILRDVARRLLPITIAHRRKIYGMDFDGGAWIEEAANPQFLAQGVFREVFAISSHDFEHLLETARVAFRVRLWSAEVWCRSVFAGQAREVIEKDLWPQGP